MKSVVGALMDFEDLQKEWKPRTLTEIRTSKTNDIVRIFADGIYDLFHPGHVELFRQIKNSFPNVELIVGVCTDHETAFHKGCAPVMSEEERFYMVRQCRYVDEAYKSVPYFPTLEYTNSLKADLIAHDAIPYGTPESEDCYAIFKKCDRFFETQRTPMISTTGLLDRILCDLTKFQTRQALRNGA